MEKIVVEIVAFTAFGVILWCVAYIWSYISKKENKDKR
jgi:hypothetical protein